MSSEAAQKAYPEDPSGAFLFRPALMQAFDRGAVEALRQARDHFRDDIGAGVRTGKDVAFILGHMVHEWEVGQ